MAPAPMISSYHAIGLMSGSSLDGLDIAYCYFEKENDIWKFSILYAECIAYSAAWAGRLRHAPEADGRTLWQLHTEYGHLLADHVNQFITKYDLTGKVDLIASHGHTIFHFPGDHCTTQIGDGASLATLTGVPVVCDMRSSDIALGGQGTPIVAIGDKLLFPQYNYLLNIGGIANLTVKTENKILAADICGANQILNHYAAMAGMEYDKGGLLASAGQLHEPLLEALDALAFYEQPYPKSLDNGFSRAVVIPHMETFEASVEDKLHTYCEHIARQIHRHISKVRERENMRHSQESALFITGGGAFNTYLTGRIAAVTGMPVHVPADDVVMYKEALVMAFIGVLRLRREPNVLSSVTGAARDTVGGALYHP